MSVTQTTPPPAVATLNDISPVLTAGKDAAGIDAAIRDDASGTIHSMDVVEPEGQSIEAEDESRYPTGSKFWLIVLSISFVLVIGGLDAGIVATAVPAITDHFHTVADVGWYYSAYKLCTSSFQFMFGKLYKIFSLKIIFMTCIAIFTSGSLLCALATSSPMFVLGRAVTGFAASGATAGCFQVLVQTVPLRKRPILTATLGIVEGVSIILAPILGGVLTQELSWRWCFYINLPLGGLTLIAVGFLFSDVQRPGGADMTWKEKLRQIDFLSTAIFVPSLSCLFIAFSWAGTRYSWDNPAIIGLLATFVILLAGFIYLQFRKGDAAALPPRIFTQRTVIAGFIFSSSCNGFISILEYYMPTYLQGVRGFTPATSGLFTVPAVIGFLIASLIHGVGLTLVGYCAPFMIVASTLMPVAGGLMTTWKVDTSFAHLILYSGLAGFAAGFAFQAPQSAVQVALPTSDASLGLAVILFAQGFGPALYVAVAQTILTNRLSKNLQHIAPGLDVSSIESMGLSDIKSSVGADKLKQVLAGFDKSIIQTWYLPLALACLTMLGSLGVEWRSMKKKQS